MAEATQLHAYCPMNMSDYHIPAAIIGKTCKVKGIKNFPNFCFVLIRYATIICYNCVFHTMLMRLVLNQEKTVSLPGIIYKNMQSNYLKSLSTEKKSNWLEYMGIHVPDWWFCFQKRVTKNTKEVERYFMLVALSPPFESKHINWP